MAGEARTSSFVLSAATVMIGPQDAMYDLNPSVHSLGLVKNVQVSQTPTYVDLTQGPKGTIIYSTLTANPTKVNFEVFEYTSSNLAYGLGLEGFDLATPSNVGVFLTNATLTGSDSSPLNAATFTYTSDVSASFPVGTWISIQEQNGTNDHVFYAQLTATTTVSGSGSSHVHTLTFANQGLGAGNNFPAGSIVSIVSALTVGNLIEQPYHSAMITAVLPEQQQPITMVFPKLKIIKGFSLSFTTDTYGNMPFEFQPFEPLPSDPFYTDFAGMGLGKLFTRT